MGKRRKPSPADRRTARAEFEVECRGMLAALRPQVAAAFRRIVRRPATTDAPLYFVIWEWFGESGTGISAGLEDRRPPVNCDFLGYDDIDRAGWTRRLGEDAQGFFRRVLIRAFGEWWRAAGGKPTPAGRSSGSTT